MPSLGFLRKRSDHFHPMFCCRLINVCTLLLAISLGGCGGGRSGTNAGNDVRFTTVLEFNDPDTSAPVADVAVTAFDGREFLSDSSGNVVTEFTSSDAPLQFSVVYQDQSGSIDLGTVQNYNPEINQGILAEVAVSLSGSGSQFKVTNITVIPKVQPDSTPDPIIDSDLGDNSASKSDKPKSEDPHAGPSTPTPTPEPTPPPNTDFGTVSVMFTDSESNPIENLSVSIPGGSSGVTTAAGRFVFQQGTFRPIDRTGTQYGTHIRVLIAGAYYGVTVTLPVGVKPHDIKQLNLAISVLIDPVESVDSDITAPLVVTLKVKDSQVLLRPKDVDSADPKDDESRDEIDPAPLDQVPNSSETPELNSNEVADNSLI